MVIILPAGRLLSPRWPSVGMRIHPLFIAVCSDASRIEQVELGRAVVAAA
jgi:hypothetical protein